MWRSRNSYVQLKKTENISGEKNACFAEIQPDFLHGKGSEEAIFS